MSHSTRIAGLTSGRSLISGVGWNLVGRLAPLVVAVGMTPILVHQMGLERWALFTLGLSMVGLFGTFDLGLGMALTRALSDTLGRGGPDTERRAAALVFSGLATEVAIALPLAAVLYWGAPVIVARLLEAGALEGEAQRAFQVLALTLPAVVVTGGAWGVVAAHQRFRAASLINIPINILYYVLPAIFLAVDDSLVSAVLALAVCRGVLLVCFLVVAGRLTPGIWRQRRLDLGFVKILFGAGFWLTVTNTLASLAGLVERFLVGSFAGLQAVAFFATPLDLVQRLRIVPVAVTTTLVPSLVTASHGAPERVASLLRRSSAIIFGTVFPAAAMIVAAAPELLGLWLGPAFAGQAASVLVILTIGITVQCLSTPMGSLLEAANRFDLQAWIQVLQAVVLMPLMVVMVWHGGLIGGALAWSLRTVLAGAVRLWLARRTHPREASSIRSLALVMTGSTLSLTVIAALGPLGWHETLAWRLAAAALLTPAMAVVGLAMLLQPEDREGLRARVRAIVLRLSPAVPGAA